MARPTVDTFFTGIFDEAPLGVRRQLGLAHPLLHILDIVMQMGSLRLGLELHLFGVLFVLRRLEAAVQLDAAVDPLGRSLGASEPELVGTHPLDRPGRLVIQILAAEVRVAGGQQLRSLRPLGLPDATLELLLLLPPLLEVLVPHRVIRLLQRFFDEAILPVNISEVQLPPRLIQ